MTVVAAISVLVNVILVIVWFYTRQTRNWRDGMSDDNVIRPEFRRFVGRRYEDVTGISGTGVPVEGVVFSDGWGVTHWLDRAPMNEPKTEVWHKPWWRRRGPDPFTKVSGHGGKTEVVWLDQT